MNLPEMGTPEQCAYDRVVHAVANSEQPQRDDVLLVVQYVACTLET